MEESFVVGCGSKCTNQRKRKCCLFEVANQRKRKCFWFKVANSVSGNLTNQMMRGLIELEFLVNKVNFITYTHVMGQSLLLRLANQVNHCT